jgi:DNA-binding protein HU-beta
MNKAELVNDIANVTGQTKSEVQDGVNAILHCIIGAMAKGDKVTLVGFGTFERRHRAARTGVNPQNPKQKLKIAAAHVPAFRSGAELKKVVNGEARLPALKIEAKKEVKAAPKKAAAKKAAPKKVAKKAAPKKAVKKAAPKKAAKKVAKKRR